MHKLLITTFIVASIAVVTVARAADVTAKVKSIDTAKSTITLADGKVYEVGKTLNLGSLKVGDKVKVTYDISGKAQVASKVEVVK